MMVCTFLNVDIDQLVKSERQNKIVKVCHPYIHHLIIGTLLIGNSSHMGKFGDDFDS